MQITIGDETLDLNAPVRFAMMPDHTKVRFNNGKRLNCDHDTARLILEQLNQARKIQQAVATIERSNEMLKSITANVQSITANLKNI